MFGAAEGAAAGHDVPVLFLPVEDLLEGDLRGGGRGEVGIGGGEWFAVEGADVLADVAAGDEVGFLHGGVELFGDVAAVFEGEVGDALGGVDGEGGDGVAGAGLDAAGAGAAVVGEGGVGGGVEVEDEFAKEEEGAVGGVDEEGVFADPSEAGAGGEVAFEEGAGVDVGAGGDFCFGEGGAEGAFEFAEFGFHDFVVVAAPGVAGDSG